MLELELVDLRNNFTYYYDFYISAKEKSFAEAGRKYYFTPSSLSRSVAKLERVLDLKLIKTNNTGFCLTIDGERLLRKLDEIFINSEISKLKNVGSNLDVVITIGTTRNIADYTLPSYLSKFCQLHPNVKVNIITDSASNLNEYLINHKIDILIDYLPHINSAEKYDLEIQPIKQCRTYFACSKKYYQLIGNKIKSLRDLKDYKLIIPGSSRRRQMLDETLQVNNFELIPTLQMPDSRLMSEIVKENDFIGYFIENEVNDFDLEPLGIKEPLPVNTIGIIYPKRTINKVAKDFIKIAIENRNKESL